MIDKETGLTDRQKRFCDEYLIDLNGTRAYKEAYPKLKSDGTARANASKLLTKSNIHAYIAKRQLELQKKTEITQEYVVNGLKEVAERCVQKIMPVLDKKGNQVHIEDEEGNLRPAFTFDSNGANRAFELLGRTLGIFVDKVNVNQDIQINVVSFSSKTLEEALKDAK